jgi:hypothetical protein
MNPFLNKHVFFKSIFQEVKKIYIFKNLEMKSLKMINKIKIKINKDQLAQN